MNTRTLTTSVGFPAGPGLPRGLAHPAMRAALWAMTAGGVLLLAGCDDHYHGYPTTPPCDVAGAPVGLYSVTGDRQVTLYWIPVTPEYVSQFVIYRAPTPEGTYYEVGHTSRDYFVDQAVANGVTYFYAVSAVDHCGRETELSNEIAFDTPRPEGYGARIYDANGDDWPRSGWEFDLARTVPWDHPEADLYYILSDGVGYLVATDLDTDIQDGGYGDFDSVDWAPTQGWSPTGTAEIIPGHVYVIWTRDNHFAKLRVISLSGDSMVFDWAYQIDPGNQELGPRPERDTAPLGLRPTL